MLLQQLFKKYLDETITREELLQLHALMNADYDAGQLDSLLEETLINPRYAVKAGEKDQQDSWEMIFSKISHSDEGAVRGKTVRLYHGKWIGWAASFLLLAGAATFWFTVHHHSQHARLATAAPMAVTDARGKTGAILILSDGSKIGLDSSRNGDLGVQGGVSLRKDNRELSYEKTTAGSNEMVYNTVMTPMGKQFQLVLSDGTRVWLNAGSSIRFPTAFIGSRRNVAVTGEVYFEVSRNEHMPFVARVNQSEIVVLGTSFNVMAYNDESNISTTLVDGAVKVVNGAQELLLKPGEQGNIARKTGRLSMQSIDADQVIAWTRGRLAIGAGDFQVLMRQVARWYDVDVVYQGKVPDISIRGILQRDVPLSTVLEFLGENGIHYKIENRTITILP